LGLYKLLNCLSSVYLLLFPTSAVNWVTYLKLCSHPSPRKLKRGHSLGNSKNGAGVSKERRQECHDPMSHGLHGAWQRAGRGGHSEENGPAKPCKGRSDPQTSRLEEETPTATSFPQGAHAVLEQ
ncbi:hypothetical protein GBF38_007916, partial [Nibea albiflora]